MKCKECIYYHKQNNTCASKKCATGLEGYVTILEKLFCKPCKVRIEGNNKDE